MWARMRKETNHVKIPAGYSDIQFGSQSPSPEIPEENRSFSETPSSIPSSQGASPCERMRAWLSARPAELTEREQAAVLALVSAAPRKVRAESGAATCYCLCLRCHAKGLTSDRPDCCPRCGASDELVIEPRCAAAWA